MRKPSVLMVGANGFIGKHLLKKLSGMKNVSVCCLIRRPSEEVEQFCSDIWIGDLRDRKSVRGITKNIDIVFHLAATGDINATSSAAYEKYGLNNVEGTRNLLKECTRNRIKKFVHFSSMAVYGHTGEKLITEKTACRPKTPYEKTKYESEKLVAKFCGKRKIPFVILRPSAVYGKGDKSDIKKLADFVKLGVVPIIGNGQNLVHMIHIDDAVDAAIKAAKVKKSGIYILNSESLSVNEIVNMLGRGKRIIKIRIPVSIVKGVLKVCGQTAGRIGITLPFSYNRIEKFSSTRRYATELAKKELGFKPRRHFKSYTY